MPSPRTTRVSLLAKIGADPCDAAAWSDFVATYGTVVVQWCRRHGLQHSDAHDVAQDVLVRFWRHAEKFHYDPARRFRSYLRRIVVTAVADWSTARRADRNGTGDTALQALLVSVPAREGLAREIEEAFDMELLDCAMRAVEGRVRPRTWEAFRLQAVDGVPAAEVASRLGMTVDNAYRARSHVLRLLKRKVAQLGNPAADPGTVAS